MTIAIGFCANDGIVLGADTQQTISGYVKTYDGKVEIIVFDDRILAIAGAGTVDYIETAKEVIREDFDKLKGWPEIQAGLKTRLLQFFHEHLSPWAAYPDRERPTVELLIGVTGTDIPISLFHYAGTAFSRVLGSPKAIGDGILLANDLIHRYSYGNYTVAQCSNLAIYILSKVKRGVEGCGGSSHIVALRKGRDLGLVDDKDIKHLEDKFRKKEILRDEGFMKSVTEKPVKISWASEILKRTET